MITLEICKALGKNPKEFVYKKILTTEQFVDAILQYRSIVKVAENLKYPYSSLQKVWKRLNPPSPVNGEPARILLLTLVNKKYCNQCESIRSISDFSSDASRPTGLSDHCKNCRSIAFSIYYVNNSEEINFKTTLRQKSLDRFLTNEETQFVFDRDGYKCQKCGLTNEEHLINHGQRLHLDHVIPVSKGGLTTIENSQLLCRSCNSSKSNKLM